MSYEQEESLDDDFSPLTLALAPQSQRNAARDHSEVASLLTPVISGCVSAASTLLAPPPQGEMAVAGAVPNNQPVPLVNATCMKATCGGALLLAGLAGYAARTFMQGPPAAAQAQDVWETSQRNNIRPTKQPRRKRQAPPPVVRLLEEDDGEKPVGTIYAKKNEIISIAVGQCGNHLNCKFWGDMLKEHKLDASGRYTGRNEDFDLSRSEVYFRKSGGSRHVPRSVLVDLEPGTMDYIKSSNVGSLFRPDNMVFGAGGSANNWAKGFYTVGAELKEEAQDIIRAEVENCECPQGFHIFQSIGGGTGSGMGSLLLKTLTESYPDRVHTTFSVFPSDKVSDVVVEPYNAVLTCNQLLEFASMTYVVDNGALCNIVRNKLKGDEPKYTDLNHIASQAMMGVTAPFRFPGALDDDLGKQNSTLIAFPRLKFLTLGQGPILNRAGKTFGTLADTVLGSNCLTEVKPEDGKVMASSLLYRGPAGDKFSKMVDAYKTGGFVGWVPDSVCCSTLENAPENSGASCTMVANTTATKGMFQKLSTQFARMYKRKAFLNHYTSEGMDEMEFQEADKNVRDLLTQYEEMDDATYEEEDI